MLNNHKKDIIYSTWRCLLDSNVENGMRIFKYIFLRRPDVKILFPFRDLEGQALENDPMFRRHATHFMQAIGAAVDNLDDLDRLTPMLLLLGEQHSQTAGFGVEYFELFTQCLMLVWEERLGDSLTAQVRAAWEKLFVFILMTLRDGFNQGVMAGYDTLTDDGEDEDLSNSDTDSNDEVFTH